MAGIKLAVFSLMAFIFFLIPSEMQAQEPPPRPIIVNVTAQTLNFGAFTHGPAGGTVTVSPGSLRTSAGDVILLGLGYSFSASLFELLANPGTVISILNGPSTALTGSNGGSITLTLDDSNPLSPFVTGETPPTPNLVYLGATITIGDAASNPPGNYSGTYNITFIQE